MSRFIIFDLDNTLVDSKHLKRLRDSRRWGEVYEKIRELRAFQGVVEIWSQLQARGIHVAVVTHTPRRYATRVLEHLALEPHALIAWHDLRAHPKPSAYGYKLAIASISNPRGLVVGDEEHDLRAADDLQCPGIFAGWCRDPVLTRAECTGRGWQYLETLASLMDLVDGVR